MVYFVKLFDNVNDTKLGLFSKTDDVEEFIFNNFLRNMERSEASKSADHL